MSQSILSLSSPRFDAFLNRVFAEFNSLCPYLRDRFVFPEGSALTFGIVERPYINASAYWHADSDSYVIAFDAGFCLWAYDMALLASELERTGIQFETTRALHWGSVLQPPLQSQLDAIDRRLGSEGDGYALYVFFSLFMSVFAHELAHIVRGHIDFVRSEKSASPLYDELYATRLQSWSESVPLRALELDADYIGAGLLSDLSEASDRFSLWSRTDPGENRAFALWGFAMFTLALEEEARRHGALPQGYPSPLLRFTLMASDFIKAEGGSASPAAPRLMERVMGMLELYEPLYPSIGAMRGFMDPAWMKTLETEVDLVLSEHELAVAQFGTFAFPERLPKS